MTGAVTDLVAFVHVADVAASAAFYEQLGFRVADRYAPGETLDWVFLEHGDARLMLARAEERIEPEKQGVLFYLYTRELDALRERVLAAGIEAPPIEEHAPHGPRRQLWLCDPDGYALGIAEIAGDRVAVRPS
jgi:catechol 2,3-dioxygenase-like lactoylglutathione lyase family enzyme